MKKIYYLTVVCAFLLSAMSANNVYAQHELPSNELMYHSFRLPQSNLFNPAFFPRNNQVYVSLPRFNVSFGFPVTYNEVGLTYDAQRDKTTLDIFQLIDKMSDNNHLNFDMELDLIGFGFRVKRAFFTFGSSIVFNANITLPKDAFDALTDNTKSLIGRDNAMILASDDFITASGYARISLGGGYEFENIPLTVGGHINILNGFANVNTHKTDIRLYATDEYYTALVASMDYRIQSAGIASYKKDKFNFDGTPSNYGFTFDLGARYIYDHFIFSAALIDVGPGIHWTQNVNTYRPKSNTITFEGVDITSLISGGEFDSTFAQSFRDSLTNTYEMVENEGSDFWYAVPTKIKLGASYTFANDMLRAGFLFHGQWDKGILCPGNGFRIPNNRFRFNTTLSLTANLKDWIEVMAGNSLVFDSHNTDLFNPGAGIIITPFKALQIYTMVDYLSSMYIVDCKNFNVSLGFNLLFGNSSKHKVVNDMPVVSLPEAASVDRDAPEDQEKSVEEPAEKSVQEQMNNPSGNLFSN
ncbi:MAG: hypothetical protein AUK63_707 [bacterium P3]|nr:MAG: hypothetical protein AUK63_707 [bacterium P3]KWW42190.1 MAG: hypothetical protein F083_529 [bacterium F083]